MSVEFGPGTFCFGAPKSGEKKPPTDRQTFCRKKIASKEVAPKSYHKVSHHNWQHPLIKALISFLQLAPTIILACIYLILIPHLQSFKDEMWQHNFEVLQYLWNEIQNPLGRKPNLDRRPFSLEL